MAVIYGSGGGITARLAGPFGAVGSAPRLCEISIPQASWKGGESPYFQTVALEGASFLTKVDLLPSAAQLEGFRNRELALTTENVGGTVTVYAIGSCPGEDLTIQALLTEMTDGAQSAGIRGATVGTTARPGDYAQTDPARADFIRNKPDTAIHKAQSTADTAKQTAEKALPKSGGTMTGAIDMDGNPVTNLPQPSAPNDPATRKYVDDKRMTASVQLPASGWSTSAPYTQTLAVNGILATDRPHYGVVYSGDNAAALAQKEAFALVDDLDTMEGSLTFTCFEEKPEVDLTIQLEVNR